jgi:zinc/manganese transport system permease protein
MEAWETMKLPLLACLLLPALLVYLGLHIVRRGIIFVDLALAQVAALGTCWCVMLGHDPHDIHTYWWSIAFTLAGALIFTFTRTSEPHRVPQEALIGIVYVVAAAASIVLLSKSPGSNEELQRTLIGDVLFVTWSQIWKTLLLYVAIAIVHFIFRRKFISLTFSGERSDVSWTTRGWDFLFYALFGLVVTSFVQIGGVLMVFTYLIVPAVCANLLAKSLGVLLGLGTLIAALGGIGGLYASYHFNIPTGAAIVCTFGAVLLVVGTIAKLRNGARPSNADPLTRQGSNHKVGA